MGRKTPFVKTSQYFYLLLLNSLGLSSYVHINADLHVTLAFVMTTKEKNSEECM